VGSSPNFACAVRLDHATSEIYYAQLMEEESTRPVLAALRKVIQTRCVFCALYRDQASHFFEMPRPEHPWARIGWPRWAERCESLAFA
jgi:hypothetical protein